MVRSDSIADFWYLLEGRYLRGPLSRQQASDLYRVGHLTDNTYVCQSGWTHWRLAKEVSGLQFAFPRFRPDSHGMIGFGSVHCGDYSWQIGLGDLSASGAYLHSDRGLPSLGSDIQGQIDVPVLHQSLKFSGKVVRSGLNSDHTQKETVGPHRGFAICFDASVQEVRALMVSSPELFS